MGAWRSTVVWADVGGSRRRAAARAVGQRLLRGARPAGEARDARGRDARLPPGPKAARLPTRARASQPVGCGGLGRGPPHSAAHPRPSPLRLRLRPASPSRARAPPLAGPQPPPG
eukprot:350354-Chlamydomonas_euryale.AAC.1